MLSKNVKQKEYNETIKELRNDIEILKAELKRKPSDDINAARHALSKCTEYKNKSEERQKQIEEIFNDISTKNSNILTLNDNIEKYDEDIKLIYQSSLKAKEEIEQLQDKIEIIDTLFNNKDDLENKINELTEHYENGNDLSNKITATYKSMQERKNEIDELYYEIYGYEEDDENDESKYVEGLRDKLKESYNKIQKDIKLLEENITSVEDNTTKQYEEFLLSRDEQYKGLVKDIEDLLPNALTAGLSYAYSKKKDDEVKESKKLEKQFKTSIYGLVSVSFIPFIVSVYLMFALDKDIISIIQDMPKLVSSILPLYIPIIWLAYSSNKKLNLSKRLIEEYTHKEVLSKTFDGLSKQIQNIEDEQISSELKTKLLYNLLSVSSENPGKLISDYNKADHPLIDALNKSSQLSDAVESLSKIPGLTKLAKILDEKALKIQRKEEEKIKKALESVKDD